MTELDSRTSKPMSIEELRLRTKLGGVSREDLLAEIERLRAALEQIIKTPYWHEGHVIAREALGAAHETPAVTVDVPKLQTDLELAHAAINRVYTGRVRDMLRLLSDNEISSARAHEWLSAFVRDGVDRPMPGGHSGWCEE